MARQHGVTSTTYKKIIVDSGAAYIDYGETGAALIGATRGGNEFIIETEMREMPVDGAKGPVKLFDRITKVNATLKVKLLEMSTAAFLNALPGSVSADFPAAPAEKTHDSITRALAIATADYLTNVALVAEVTGNSTSPAVLLLKNPISTGPFSISCADADEGVLELTFRASFDSSTLDTEPWEIRYPVIA
jgi:hypothetical protein